jgi:hypothetical protein
MDIIVAQAERGGPFSQPDVLQKARKIKAINSQQRKEITAMINLPRILWTSVF